MPLRILIVASENAVQQAERRKYAGAASHESYAAAVRSLNADCNLYHHSCVSDPAARDPLDLRQVDAILFAGSPIQMFVDSEETRSAAAFMTRVYRSGVPSFGSCAGLQIAAVAAGGTCKPREGRMEAGFARRIVATEAGLSHRMIEDRPATWDAPAMHSSVVDRHPEGMTVLAFSADTPVQAAQIRSEGGEFWGVQYHPELSLSEIAASLPRQLDDLIQQGLVKNEVELRAHQSRIATLGDQPDRTDLAWQLGIDDEIVRTERRTLELQNFLRYATERAV